MKTELSQEFDLNLWDNFAKEKPCRFLSLCGGFKLRGNETIPF